MSMSRRDGLRLGAAAALAAALPRPVRSQPAGIEIPARDIERANAKILANAPRIAIPSYRCGLVVRSGVSASSLAGGVRVEAAADLAGIDLAQMRAMATQAMADLRAALEASGRTIVPKEEMRSSSGWQRLEFTPQPFVKKPFADARTSAFIAPDGCELVTTHLDQPSDRGPGSLGNWRALNQMCVDLDCVVLLPSVTIDFATMSGSGRSLYSGSASVDVRPGLFLVPGMTQCLIFHAKIPLAGPIGVVRLKDRVALGEAGELIETARRGNRQEVEWWNLMAAGGTTSMPDWARPSQAQESASYIYVAEPKRFSELYGRGAHAFNRVLGEAAATLRPA